MKLFISEVFEKIKSLSSDEEKVQFLKNNLSVPLQHFLYQNFSNKIEFLLPSTPAPYKPTPYPITLADANLYRAFKKMYLFYKGGHPSLHQARREQLWIQLLEGLAKEEAEFLETLKNKNLEQRYGVTRKLVDLVFPNLLEKLPADASIVFVPVAATTIVAEVQVEVTEKPIKKTKIRKKKNESKTGNSI